MKIKYTDIKPTSIKNDFLTFPYDLKSPKEADSMLTRFGGKLLAQYKKQQEFAQELGKKLMIVSSRAPVQFAYTEVLSEDQPQLMQAIRNWGARARSQAEKSHAKNVDVYFANWMTGDHAQAWFEGFYLSGYAFERYKQKSKKPSVKEVTVHIDLARKKELQGAHTQAEVAVRGIELARDLVNTPGHDMTPTHLAEIAERIARESEGLIKATIYSEVECQEMGMGAYLAVSKGTIEPPKFIHLVYTPNTETEKRIAVVGKGVTFDSGGLSIKPSQHMEDMKVDMAGSATVLGLFESLAKLNIPVEVHGIIAAVENMPSGSAIRPGDIVRAANGISIEILNTDAEGRLTLADALLFAQKQKPDAVIDLATLTGACVVGLGEEIAAMYSNNDELAKALEETSAEAGEELWRMPLHDAYDKLIDSKIADIRNTATTPYGGSITAAMFLKRFVNKEIPWAHIDIAGPAYAEKPLNAYTHYGASGYGVATMLHYLKKHS